MSSRPKIESGIKLEVRQRDRFGCVHCGSPIFHYEHYEDYATVGEHTAENIYLLCPDMHSRKEKAITRSEIQEWRDNPWHQRNDGTKPEPLGFRGSSYSLQMGEAVLTNTVGTSATALTIDGHTLLGFTAVDNRLLLDLRLQLDSGTEILTVEEGELTMRTKEAWDITWVGNELSVRCAPRQYLLRVRYELESGFVNVLSGRFHFAGRTVIVDSGSVVFDPSSPIQARFGTQSTRNREVMFAVGGSPGDYPSYSYHHP